MNNIKGALYEVSSNLKTKRNEVQPSKVSVTPSSVQKAMSSGGSGKTSQMAGGRLFQARASATGNARS